MSAGKGDTYRPVDWEKWKRNYERIFGCQDTTTDNENCNGRATPDPDINPAAWEEKDG